MKEKKIILISTLFLILIIGCQKDEENCFYSPGDKLDAKVIKKIVSKSECLSFVNSLKRIDL